MKVAIMTDTNSGILPNEGAEKGIYVLPMPFIVDGENYLEIDGDGFDEVIGNVYENKELLGDQK